MTSSATSDPKGGLILSHIITNGATIVTKRLALKRIRELKPANFDAATWTVDAFLSSNRKRILNSKQGRSNECIYFPKNSVTDIDKWDVSATIFILIETCDLGKKLVMYLENLRKLRNTIVHIPSTTIEEHKFKYYQTKLSVILDECLKEIGDDALAKDIEIMYQQLNDGTIFSKTSETQHHGHAEEKEVLEKQDRVADATAAKRLDKYIKLLHRLEPPVTEVNNIIHGPDEDNRQKPSNNIIDLMRDHDNGNERKDSHVIKRNLSKTGLLPDQRLLNQLCSEFGRKSEVIKDLCCMVCKHIKSTDKNVIDVWPAYTTNDENEIIFVVVVRENVHLEKKIKYSYRKRLENQYSLEAKEVVYSKRQFSLDQDELQKLKTAVCNHATELMKRHKYLSIISGSSVRSKNYGIDPKNTLNLVQEGCIVLYVHTKHFIPIDEEPFEKFYDGVPVDVREGEFLPYVLTATDYHENIKLGCQIGNAPDSNTLNCRVGCLGCFVDHPEYNLCGLTCAHVLLYPWGMEQVKTKGGTEKWPNFHPYETVYQPGGANPIHEIGKIVQAVYIEGDGQSSGMEVALFQIERRHPNSGNLPAVTEESDDADLNFDSGKSCGFSRINRDSQAIKYGPVTRKTLGEFEREPHDVAVKTFKNQWDYSEVFRITLYNQLHVKGAEQDIDGNTLPFSAVGDSGALVFIKEADGELVCVGMVEGGTSFGTTIVTPIKPILQKLGVPNIKSFENEKVLKKLITSSIENALEGFKTALLQDVKNLLRK